MYVTRLLGNTLSYALEQFPTVLITGPRQSGKTTFLLNEFGRRFEYVTFDDPLERSYALTDPNGFLDRFGNRPVIMDEIQYVPELFPYLKIRIDREREKKGRWLLTGSQQFQLMKNISESLAGRIALLELLPFSLLELEEHDGPGLDDAIWTGLYPEPALYPDRRDLWVRSYIQTYIERDVRQLKSVRDLRAFEIFLAMCAARHGQAFQAASISRDCGITVPTVKAWTSVMEASYLCVLLHPYYKNFGKRIVKTPKLYFIDPGLVCALTRQPNGEAALVGPMAGALFEGLIVGEALKVFASMGKKAELYFWRSRDGLEVDLLVAIEDKLHPVEIKLTSTPTLKHIEPLDRFISLAHSEAASGGILVCSVKTRKALPNGHKAIPWREFPQWLMSQMG